METYHLLSLLIAPSGLLPIPSISVSSADSTVRLSSEPCLEVTILAIVQL